MFAQNEKEEFDSAYTKLKVTFSNGKYSEALDSLSTLKKIISKEQKIKSVSLIKDKDGVFDNLYKNAKSPAKFHIGNETIKIYFGDKKIYTIKSKYKSAALFSSQLPVEFKGKLAVKNKYLKINNQTKIVEFVSNNKDILTIDSIGNFKVKNTGNVIITISVDNHFVQIPLKIIAIPLTKMMTRDKVIETLGMADEVNKKYIGWLKSSYVDGIFYYANTDNGRGISVEHWIYKKYPKAIFRFNYLGLGSCVMASWDSLSSKKYSLEHK